MRNKAGAWPIGGPPIVRRSHDSKYSGGPLSHTETVQIQLAMLSNTLQPPKKVQEKKRISFYLLWCFKDGHKFFDTPPIDS